MGYGVVENVYEFGKWGGEKIKRECVVRQPSPTQWRRRRASAAASAFCAWVRGCVSVYTYA